jgi:hypothetical protein
MHVCLSLCQGEDELVYAYMCGQTALEGKEGKALLEDMWEAYVEDHPGVRNKIESMLAASKQLQKSIESGDRKPRASRPLWQQLEQKHKAAVYLLGFAVYFALFYVVFRWSTQGSGGALASTPASSPAPQRPMQKVPASLSAAITE